MIILPAIDLSGGQVVRLTRGDYDKKDVYASDPKSVAEGFATQGASYLHVVDLDGAKDGSRKNSAIVQAVSQVGLHIELGGGIRTPEIAKMYIDIGVSRIIIGTQAIKDFGFIEKLIGLYGEKVCVSIDAKDVWRRLLASNGEMRTRR